MESFFFLLIFTCLELSTGYSTLSFNSFTSLLRSQLNYDMFIIFPVAQMVKNPPIIQETGFEPWVGKIPWRRAWQPTPVFLRGESPWTEEPGGLQSMGSKRAGLNWATKLSTCKHLRQAFNFHTHSFSKTELLEIFPLKLVFLCHLPLPSHPSFTSLKEANCPLIPDVPVLFYLAYDGRGAPETSWKREYP